MRLSHTYAFTLLLLGGIILALPTRASALGSYKVEHGPRHRVLLNATSSHVVHFKAVLSGSEVAPTAGGPVNTKATGEATAVLIGDVLMHGAWELQGYLSSST